MNLYEELVWANETRGDGAWSAECAFPAGAPYFRGHFPGFPIVPGVVQLGTAWRMAARFLGRELVPSGVRKMKFTRVIRPDETVRLSLAVRAPGEIAYAYRKGGETCASGILCF